VSSAIELRHSDPLIWRQVEVTDHDHAHDIIQPAMGWFDEPMMLRSARTFLPLALSFLLTRTFLPLSFLLTRTFLPLALSFLLNSINSVKMVLQAPDYKLER